MLRFCRPKMEIRVCAKDPMPRSPLPGLGGEGIVVAGRRPALLVAKALLGPL